MRFADDFLQYFVQNFSDDIFIHFRDGLWYPIGAQIAGDNEYYNIGTGVVTQEQPVNAPWMAVKFLPGSIRYATIGTASSKMKEQGFIFNVRIFTPKGQSNKLAYELQDTLSELFSFDSIPAGDARIYSDYDVPLIPREPNNTTKDAWSELRLSYNFYARYF